MSSTDRPGPDTGNPDAARDPDDRVARFFDEHLIPAARALRERGVELLPPGPDPARDSYYVPCRPDPVLSRLEPDDVAAWLTEQWQAAGLDELAALVTPLLELARELDTRDEPSDEVAPEIYVMF